MLFMLSTPEQQVDAALVSEDDRTVQRCGAKAAARVCGSSPPQQQLSQSQL